MGGPGSGELLPLVAAGEEDDGGGLPVARRQPLDARGHPQGRGPPSGSWRWTYHERQRRRASPTRCSLATGQPVGAAVLLVDGARHGAARVGGFPRPPDHDPPTVRRAALVVRLPARVAAAAGASASCTCPAARYFGCRHCHDLAYTSSQEAHQGDAMLAGSRRRWACPALHQGRPASPLRRSCWPGARSRWGLHFSQPPTIVPIPNISRPACS